MDLKDILNLIITIFVMLTFIYYVYTENRVEYYKFLLNQCERDKIEIAKNCLP